MDLDMESDREFFTETAIEDCRGQKPLHSPIYESEKYHHTKAEPSKSRLVNKSRHGDFRLEPEDEKEYCNENSHSPAFVSGQGDLTKVRKIKIRFLKKVVHEISDVAGQSLKRKSEDRTSGEARKRKKEMDAEGGKGKKSVEHESSDEAEQSLRRKSEDRASGKAREEKEDMDNQGGRENKSVGHESSDEAEQSLKRKSEARKRKKAKDNEGAREKKLKSVSKIKRLVSSGDNFEKSRSNRNDTEIEEMWNTIAGDSEDNLAGQRTIEDDAFIDDTGVDPHDRLPTDDDFIHFAPQAEEGEEDDEIDNLFKSKKKKKKGFERSAEETAMVIEQFLAKFEVAAEEDAEFNRQSRPAVNKLKTLPLLTEVLSKKHLQQEFLDRGILSVLKNWLEPLPDGCLPNINIRTAILKILTDLPVNIEQFDRRELLKKSGIGKSIMFLSKSDEEIPSNRKLAKDLVGKWIRPIFQKSTRYEDMKDFGEERDPYRRPPPTSITEEKAMALRFEDDVDGFEILELSHNPKPGERDYRPHASRPEASRLDYVVRPPSKIDPEEIRARTRQGKQSERWAKLDKKLKNLKAPKKKKLQAAKISVEGRGLVKYL